MSPQLEHNDWHVRRTAVELLAETKKGDKDILKIESLGNHMFDKIYRLVCVEY